MTLGSAATSCCSTKNSGGFLPSPGARTSRRSLPSTLRSKQASKGRHPVLTTTPGTAPCLTARQGTATCLTNKQGTAACLTTLIEQDSTLLERESKGHPRASGLCAAQREESRWLPSTLSVQQGAAERVGFAGVVYVLHNGAEQRCIAKKTRSVQHPRDLEYKRTPWWRVGGRQPGRALCCEACWQLAQLWASSRVVQEGEGGPPHRQAESARWHIGAA
jgi:hypothetical protein